MTNLLNKTLHTTKSVTKGNSLMSVLINLFNAILNKIVWFGPTVEYVNHEIHWNVATADAWQICTDYSKFIRLMLSDQEVDPNPVWLKGGPGEVGGQLQYTIARDGSVNIIVEEVTKLEVDPTTGVCTLAWEQLSSEPQYPMRGYGCTWVLKPEKGEYSDPCCHLLWTRHFKEPKLFGIISLSNMMKWDFRFSSIPIMDTIFRQYYAQTYPPAGRRLPKPGEKVVVVGAGPSGLHMAHLLRNRLGIEDITILERTGRHGGKTVSVPDSLNPGVIHELGTCYLSPAYFAVRALFQELKQMPGCDLPKFGEEVEPLNYAIRRPGLVDQSLPEWITTNVEVQPHGSIFSLTRILFPLIDTGIELLLAKERYNKLHAEIIGSYSYTMPPRLPADKLQEIDMSFGQFLDKHRLNALIPLLAYGQTCQGYGSIENTPTFWAMCWVTPDLLNGYFSIKPGHLPKKSMLVTGWGSVWDMMIKVNNFNIEYNTTIHNITRPDGTSVVVTGEQEGGVFEREYDYLVMAAPLTNKTDYQVVCPLDLRPEEAEILQSDTITASTFRTNLFHVNQPQPYLDTHLVLYPNKVIGPEVGMGDVFASRDSYLALNPQYSSLRGMKDDPNRNNPREQMAYQWVEMSKELSEDYLDNKFAEWADAEFGTSGGYEVLKPNVGKTSWTYFQHYGRMGLNQFLPWQALELQGKNRTLFVHASNFFESVLDIVNFNNMLVDGLTGKINSLINPTTDDRPAYYQTDHWEFIYNKLTRFLLTLLDIVLGLIWTVLYIPIRPILNLTFLRWQRYYLQKAFKTQNLGPWYKFTMSYFIQVSPSVVCFVNNTEDPIITDTKAIMAEEHPEIPKVNMALKLGYQDYRTTIQTWIKVINPTFFTWIGPRIAGFIRNIGLTFPVLYNYVMSWFFCISFNQLTGYSVRIEDERGGGCYVPKCDMQMVAREEYGDELGCRICSHVCKIFTEEVMRTKGVDCTFEPNFAKGSCMIRAIPVQNIAFVDHTISQNLAVNPDNN